MTTSFKERVKNIAIIEAQFYQKVFVENTYLIFSENFKNKAYYILSAEQNNYLHLIGVNTCMTSYEFFKKCLNGTLKEEDFDFFKSFQSEKSVKGSVRRKINCLPQLKTMFESDCLMFQEDFKRNKIKCALATTDQEITLGFASGRVSRPKTLLKGNELTNPMKVELILSKRREDLYFNKIVYGDMDALKKNMDVFHNIVSVSLKKEIYNKDLFSFMFVTKKQSIKMY